MTLVDVATAVIVDKIRISIIIDVDEIRLQKAKNLGADFIFNVQCQRDAKMLAKQIEDLMGGQPDCSMECTGDEPSLQLAIFVIWKFF